MTVYVVYLCLVKHHLAGVDVDELLFTGSCQLSHLVLVLTFLAQNHRYPSLIFAAVCLNQVLEGMDVLLVTHS